MLLGILIGFGWAAYGQIARGIPFENPPLSNTAMLLIFAAVLLVVVWIYAVKLVTEVDDQEVRTQFVLLSRRQRIPVHEIREVQAVTYRPLIEYGGWGIRRGANGWAYNVSGNRGVRIYYHNGRQFLIGSQRAEELERAIQERMSIAR